MVSALYTHNIYISYHHHSWSSVSSVQLIQLNVTVYKLHYRSTPLHTSSSVTMPVSAYTAEERGETNTDSYKVFVKDSEGVY